MSKKTVSIIVAAFLVIILGATAAILILHNGGKNDATQKHTSAIVEQNKMKDPRDDDTIKRELREKANKTLNSIYKEYTETGDYEKYTDNLTKNPGKMTDVYGDKTDINASVYLGLGAFLEQVNKSKGKTSFSLDDAEIVLDKKIGFAMVSLDPLLETATPFSLQYVYADGEWKIFAEGMFEQIRISSIYSAAKEATNKAQ